MRALWEKKEHWKQHSNRAKHFQYAPILPHLWASAPHLLSTKPCPRSLNLPNAAQTFEFLYINLRASSCIDEWFHLSRHYVAHRPFPARQLGFRIMGALHRSPDHAMIVHLCDLSVNLSVKTEQQGRVQSGEGHTVCARKPFFAVACADWENEKFVSIFPSHSATQ